MNILEVSIDGGTPVQYPIGEGPVLIGRDSTSDVCIDDPAVERRHAKLALEWCLSDIANGQPLVLRGRRVSRDWIEFGEEFSVGSAGRVRARLVATPAPGSASELDELRSRVRELEATRVELEARVCSLEDEVEALRSGEARATGALTLDQAIAWVHALAPRDGPSDDDLRRLDAAGIEQRLRILLEVLLGFVERLEGRTDRVARIGGGPGTFEDKGLRREIGRALAATSPEHARELLVNHTQLLLRTWVNSTLKVYRSGVEIWAQTLLNRLAPKTIQIRAGVTDAKLEFGLGYKRLWAVYSATVLELTAAVLVEEIDDTVQRVVDRVR